MLLNERFTKNERLRKEKEFKKVFNCGRKKRDKSFTVFNVSSSGKKVGIIISRYIKGSIIRNKLKRRLRDIYRKNKDCFNGETIVIAYPGAEKLTYSEMKNDVLKLISLTKDKITADKR